MSLFLKLQDLFNTAHRVVKAVDGVSFELNENEIIGIAIKNISYLPNGELC